MESRKRLISMLHNVLEKLKKTATEDLEKVTTKVTNDDEALKKYVQSGKGAIDTILRETMVQKLKLVLYTLNLVWVT